MMLNNDPDTQDRDAAESKRVENFIVLVRKGLEVQADIPTAKRKESEACYFDAVTAETEEDEYEGLIAAIYNDPANAQALLDLSEFFELTAEEDLDVVSDIVRLAEARLGEAGIRECAGHFWTFLETRPLMRALLTRADLFNTDSQLELADADYERLLALDPDDHLNVRVNLVLNYLQEGRADKAAPHLDACLAENADYALFRWCRVLERFLAGDAPGAAEALDTARRANGYCEAYIIGHKQLPLDHQTAHHTPGSRSEAAAHAPTLYAIWTPHPEAIKWLFAQPKANR